MNFGEKIAEGKPEAVKKNPEVIRIYLGHSFTEG
jgi:ABC-type branched-subunit amino acid transport system ATPase component